MASALAKKALSSALWDWWHCRMAKLRRVNSSHARSASAARADPPTATNSAIPISIARRIEHVLLQRADRLHIGRFGKICEIGENVRHALIGNLHFGIGGHLVAWGAQLREQRGIAKCGRVQMRAVAQGALPDDAMAGVAAIFLIRGK